MKITPVIQGEKKPMPYLEYGMWTLKVAHQDGIIISLDASEKNVAGVFISREKLEEALKELNRKSSQKLIEERGKNG